MNERRPKFDIRPISISEVRGLCERHHGYGSCGNVAVYAFGVIERGSIVAAYAWNPPPPGATLSICPEAPWAVLALSRMVAVPKSERELNHVSRPLRWQMMNLIDRGRWPVLVTYSDEGQGHTGHVYKCSGWTPTVRSKRATFTNTEGVRTSTYSAGNNVSDRLIRSTDTYLQRWEHWACERGGVESWCGAHGWMRRSAGVWKRGTIRHEITRQMSLLDGLT